MAARRCRCSRRLEGYFCKVRAVTKLRVIYEQKVATAMSGARLKRIVPGFFAAPIGDKTWKGLSVSLLMRRGGLSVFPALGVYCPEAYKVMNEMMQKMGAKGFMTGAMSQKIGVPFFVRPLHLLITNASISQRSALSYDIGKEEDIQQSVNLLHHDFLSVSSQFFASIRDLDSLIEQIVSEDSRKHTSAAINAMTLTVTKDKNVPVERLRDLRALYPSPLTERFCEVLSASVVARRA